MNRASFLKIFIPAVSISVLAFVLLIYLSLATVAPVLYPIRIDSAYVSLKNQELITQTYNDTVIDPIQLLYHPSQMNVSVADAICKTSDGNVLNGWYYNKPKNPSGTAILMIHNLGDSKISLMESCRLFNDYGFYVFCFDMPAHGNSTGDIFSMENRTIQSLKTVVDTIFCNQEIENLAVIGTGFNSYLAARIALEIKPQALILNDPVNSVDEYLQKITENRWGGLSVLVNPFIIRLYEFKTGVRTDSLILSSLIKKSMVPLMIAVTSNSVLQNEVGDAVKVFRESSSPVKKIWTDKAKGFITNTNDEEKNYYRAVSAFINSNIPKKEITKRKRKSIVEL